VPEVNDIVASETELRAIYGEPKKLAAAAKSDRLDALCRQFIALSPLVCVSTSNAEGRQDASPRGDAPGFVRVLDDHTLVIPDRTGNGKIETLTNLVLNPRIGLLFIIPGHEETLRINGFTRIARDQELLSASIFEGKLPKCVIVVTVEEVYPHCGKAFRRARLWDVDARPGREAVPSLAAIAIKMARITDRKVEDLDAQVQRNLITELY
jgi:PPOX class probable FMN-dependent enzyme